MLSSQEMTMTPFLRLVALLLAAAMLLPVLASCGKSQKAMQSPDGLSNRQRRDQAKGNAGQ